MVSCGRGGVAGGGRKRKRFSAGVYVYIVVVSSYTVLSIDPGPRAWDDVPGGGGGEASMVYSVAGERDGSYGSGVEGGKGTENKIGEDDDAALSVFTQLAGNGAAEVA